MSLVEANDKNDSPRNSLTFCFFFCDLSVLPKEKIAKKQQQMQIASIFHGIDVDNDGKAKSEVVFFRDLRD